MASAKVIPLDDSIALYAADLSLDYQLALADSIVYATALSHRVKLITSDRDFKGLPQVVYFQK